MMHRFAIAMVALTLVSQAAAAQNAPASGAFVLRTRTDTIVIERFTRTGDTLQGSISTKSQPRLDYVAVIGIGQAIRSLSIDVFTSDLPGAEPVQRASVSMRGDSAFVNVGGTVHGFATVAGAIPLVSNSFALAEVFTARARAGNGVIEIPGFAVSGGVTLTVGARAAAGDTMHLTIGGTDEVLRVDRSGRILGGTIPAQHIEILRVDGIAAATLRMGRVDYSPPPGAPYTATEVTLTGQNGIRLGGTLTVPSGATGRVPAVVTITGSGQQDRDEFIPVAGGYRPFRQVADTLGRRGIAVLRLDDRMIGASGGKIGTSADYADDIRAAVAFLRRRPEIDPDRIALLGHSEGGMIAPMVAATDPRLKGIVLLAGPADRGADIIHYQQRNAIDADPAIRPAARDSAAKIAAIQLDSIGRADVWLGFFLQYDPLVTAGRVHVPALILQGATDHQVTADQAEKLGAAMRAGGNRDVTVHVFPDRNHLFIVDPNGAVSGYATLKSNRISPDVLGLLADWLVEKLGAH